MKEFGRSWRISSLPHFHQNNFKPEQHEIGRGGGHILRALFCFKNNSKVRSRWFGMVCVVRPLQYPFFYFPYIIIKKEYNIIDGVLLCRPEPLPERGRSAKPEPVAERGRARRTRDWGVWGKRKTSPTKSETRYRELFDL